MKTISKKSKDYKSYYAFNKSLDKTKKRYPSLNIMESVIVKNQYTLNTYDEKISSKFKKYENLYTSDLNVARKLIIKFYNLIKDNELFNIWISEASESFEIKGRKTPRTQASKFDKIFIETVFNKDNKKDVNTLTNDFKKQDKEFLKVENNLNVLKKLMVDCLRKVQKDTGKYLDADISKLRVAFTVKNRHILGTHYCKKWDKGNFKDKHGNKVSHIVIRKNILMSESEKILYNPSSFEDTSAVALHELIHLIIPNSGNHNQAFEDCLNDFKQKIISGKNSRSCHTYHMEDFKKYFSEIYKRLSKEWNASEGMHTNIKEKSKTISYKCLLTKVKRCTITNESAKASGMKLFSDCGDDITAEDLIAFEELTGKRLSPMLPYTKNKPKTYTEGDK